MNGIHLRAAELNRSPRVSAGKSSGRTMATVAASRGEFPNSPSTQRLLSPTVEKNTNEFAGRNTSFTMLSASSLLKFKNKAEDFG